VGRPRRSFVPPTFYLARRLGSGKRVARTCAFEVRSFCAGPYEELRTPTPPCGPKPSGGGPGGPRYLAGAVREPPLPARAALLPHARRVKIVLQSSDFVEP
jgi:hypothetical protein